MLTNILYSLKVWLTSVLVAPVFYLIILNAIRNHDPAGTEYDGSNWFMYAVCLVLGLLFSFIVWFVFLLIIMLVTRFAADIITAKFIICITGVALTIGAFRFVVFQNGFTFDEVDGFIYLMLANCLCIGFGSWIYKLTLLKSAETNTKNVT